MIEPKSILEFTAEYNHYPLARLRCRN